VVEDIPPFPCPTFKIGNFTRLETPPIAALPLYKPSNWVIVQHQDMFLFQHGEWGIYIIQQLDYAEEQSLREYTLLTPNLLTYKARLRILYRLIGEVAFAAKGTGRVLCIIFIILSAKKTKILCELVAAHGSQLYRCTDQERTESWVTFDGTEEPADYCRIEEAVNRAAALTAYEF
jgi:hypothetical protein